MSSLALHRDFRLRHAPVRRPGSARVSALRIFRRISAAIERWRQRQIDQEAARFIAEHGGRLTDDIERQLTEHFNGRGFPPYAPPHSFRPFA
jgi:hypothetical protein